MSNHESSSQQKPTADLDTNDFYLKRSRKIRAQIAHMMHKANASHIGSCFSIVDILTVLYSGILQVTPDSIHSPQRDRFILSKGHAAAAVYANLCEAGFFTRDLLERYCQNAAPLGGHITANVPGVEVSTGSLGHGLSIGCGMALASRSEKQQYRIFVLMSDGECDEGSVWEAALFAPYHNLENLTIIIDYNKIQSFDRVKDVLDLEPLADKWKSFGWAVQEIDGHNFEVIKKTFMDIPFEKGKPSCIIAHTIKGKGISFMEDKLEWHYKSPTKEQLELSLKELGVDYED